MSPAVQHRMVTNFSPWGKTPFAFVSFRLSCSGLLVLTQSKQGCGGIMLNKIVLMSFYSSTSRVQPLWRSLVPDLVPSVESDAPSSSRYHFLCLMFYFLSNPRGVNPRVRIPRPRLFPPHQSAGGESTWQQPHITLVGLRLTRSHVYRSRQ